MKQIFFYIALGCLLAACQKQEEWLDAKSTRSDVTPSTLKDYQALLDNTNFMNDVHPGMPVVCSDNYYVPFTTWQGETSYTKSLYIWQVTGAYDGAATVLDWSTPYYTIAYANIVLEGLEKIPQTTLNKTAWLNIKGSALFYRAYAFFALANEFAKPYDATTAGQDLGIPLRLTADVNEPSVRATLKETYTRILTDCMDALAFLPDAPQYQTRPSTYAVYALLSRVSLVMGDYVNAALYADKALAGPYRLIDFNTLSATSSYTMPAFPNNPEIVFFAKGNTFSIFLPPAFCDSLLLRSYSTNDLRRTLFYSTANAFRGGYCAGAALFCGLAINEQYLVKAEAEARAGNTANAMQALNTLLQKRWKTGTFVPLTAANANAALDLIIAERRKELPFTGNLRWMDLRRLNTDTRYATTLTRVLNNQTYTLPPNDKRYVLPIPDLEIRLSGIQQNP